MHVIVPVKSFALAKSRLMPLVDNDNRRRLARAMAHSVLTELVSVSRLQRVLVVSSEPEIAGFCQRIGLDYLWDDGSAGLNGALVAAEKELQVKSDDAVAVICADLPFFRGAEFERMRQQHDELGGNGLTLASDQLGQGTNVRIVTAPKGLAYRFGEASALRHFEEAARCGIAHQFFHSEAFMLDLDTPDNAVEVAQRRAEIRQATELSALIGNLSIQHAGEARKWVH